jgi:hypothetical protein
MTHKSLYSALATAQAEMGPAIRDAKNPHLGNRYADLSAVLDAVMPALNKNGIAMFQPTYNDETGRYVKTVLVHGESGETVEWLVPLIVDKNNMQGYGSAVTYARRYGAMCIGVAPADDDDGNKAANAPPNETPEPAKSSAALKKVGVWEQFMTALDGCQSMLELDKLREEYREKAREQQWNLTFKNQMKEEFEKAEAAFSQTNILMAGE